LNQRQKSEVIIAKILNYLSENGTKKCTIEISTIDPKNEISIEKSEFLDTLNWLEQEGMIRSGAGWLGLVGRSDCVLTAYGFGVLGSPFGQVGTVGSVAKEINDNNGSGLSNIGDFLGGLVGGFTKSISS
jgi:hypothetical protein